MNAKEAKARIKINQMLERSGWRFFDDKDGKANIVLELNVKLKKSRIDALGNDFESTKNGFIDYLLLNEKSFPVCVLEAKAEKHDPLVGKEQARKYAKSQNARFIILSNGNLSYFWDLEHGNPTVITELPTPKSLYTFGRYKPSPEQLTKEILDSDYVALTQNPSYKNDPRWSDSKSKSDYIREADLKFLRPYQIKAINSIQKAVKDGQSRFLFEMATGTGKTLTAAGVIKLFLQTGNASRVLFLVDRLELETQARKAFVRYLKNDYTAVIFKESKDDWHKAEIVISTVQTLLANDKFKKIFSPTDFDLVISDEAHRSLGGNSRAVFEYFVGYKLGLTATPKDYLKNIKADLKDNDPRQWERRQLLDTYKTFGCETGTPTFRYTLLDGVKDGYLINPIVVDARTEITTDMLSEQGYSVTVINEDGEKEEQTYFGRDFEKKFYSDKSNRIFCETFLKNALRDPVSGEIGKSIVFCVSQKHASKITQMLNEIADQMFPDKYQSDFAVQVTSFIPDAQQMSISFANNNLNGHTKILDGYLTSKTRVCVTVGMMTTGYDCEDILNIVLLRPIFSPTDFIQIKGRGTRKYTFTYIEKDGSYKTEHKHDKEKFKLFDFFANYEYFEKDFKYDEEIKLPRFTGSGKTVDPPPPPPKDKGYTNFNPDPLKCVKETAITAYGMKIDRKFYDQFEEAVKANPEVKKIYAAGDVKGAEAYVVSNIFDKPEQFFNIEKLRRALQLDRRVGLKEILAKIFGEIKEFKTRDQMLDEELSKFVSVCKPDAMHMPYINHFFRTYITDGEVRAIVDKKEFARLADNPKLSISDIKALNGWKDTVAEYVKDYVAMNTYL